MVEDLDAFLPVLREANWYDTPEDWRKELEELKPRAVRKALGPTLIAAAGASVAMAPAFETAGWLTLPVPIVCAGFVWYKSYRLFFDQELQKRLLGPPQDQVLEWEVFLDVVQGGVVTGRDRGRVWVEEGRLMFLGRRTSFSMTSDVLPVGRGVVTFAGFNGSTTGYCSIRVRPSLTNEPTWLKFRVLWRTCDCWTGMSTFKTALSKLKSERLDGGQLPPLSVGPGADSFTSILSFAAFNLVALISALVLTVFFEEAAFITGPIAVVAGLFLAKNLRALATYNRIKRRESAKPLSQVSKLV